MQVKCFACDTLMHQDDLGNVRSAFHAHAGELHRCAYLENALRNSAHTYVEAIERSSVDAERRSVIAGITVHAVEGAPVADLLRSFNHDSFPAILNWESCCGVKPHLPSTPDRPERPWREPRAFIAQQAREGTTYGYRAHVDGGTAGWAKASSRADCGLFREVDPRHGARGATSEWIMWCIQRSTVSFTAMELICRSESQHGRSSRHSTPTVRQ